MRIWHYKLLPYLPDAQFKGQLRELVAIMHDWRDKGGTNHLLINKVVEYHKRHLTTYFMKYCYWYGQRYHRLSDLLTLRFLKVGTTKNISVSAWRTFTKSISLESASPVSQMKNGNGSVRGIRLSREKNMKSDRRKRHDKLHVQNLLRGRFHHLQAGRRLEAGSRAHARTGVAELPGEVPRPVSADRSGRTQAFHGQP